ncbi:MAG: sulfatase, partial [Pirellulales bacterium]
PYGAHDRDMLGTFLAGEAARFLRQERDRPFFLVASFHEPHSPFHFPIEYAGTYEPAEFEVPRVELEDDWQIPEIFRDLTVSEKQGIIAAYYTSTAWLDKNVGRVLSALEGSGQAQDTLVVYLGDHGYSLGQHGRFEKHCFYEPAVRAPLVMRYPGRIAAGDSSAALVEFIDVVPTILELCGVEVPAGVQGRSLVPVLTGRCRRHRDYVVSEYLENEEAMIRTERWKFIYTTGRRERQDGYATGRPLPGRTRRLYDLARDPEEMHNLADLPRSAGTVDHLEELLYVRLISTQPDGQRVPCGLPRADAIDWCLVPR